MSTIVRVILLYPASFSSSSKVDTLIGSSEAIAGAAISISAASIAKNIFIRFNITIILSYSGEKLKSETGQIRAR
ncbi:hypothetical protein [Cloacibacillus porcorum]|uniref:hypothetical protein n=1 Tax=Cloacibacillus porcorum TaxID=1197717 RepID=UPI002357B249|nr:hypothetical protein [Cloacibacillus porcorum]